MSDEHAIILFDHDFVEALLSLTWPEYLRRHGFDGGEWDAPEDFLTEFALDPHPDNDALAKRIVRSWTLRRTIRRCSPPMFFIETVLNSVASGTRSISIWDRNDGVDLFADLATLRDAMILAFLDGRINASSFRAVMRVIDSSIGHDDFSMSRLERSQVERALRNNGPKRAFVGVPPSDDQYTTLSCAQTEQVLRLIDEGLRRRWPISWFPQLFDKRIELPGGGHADFISKAPKSLRECRVVAELRRAQRRFRGRRIVLSYYYC